ncbi:MAG: radical SAM family heme chaperone HemW [Clostridia bacterium]|nr:radical SAM family heme chaperone HemW [Clostridia bacterium]
MITNKAGVYVHFPFCKSKCAYCSFVSTPNIQFQSDYFTRLKTEIKEFGEKVEISTIYFGGGTPSVVDRGIIGEIASEIKKKFVLTSEYEFTVECNPESVTDEFCREIVDAGVNRVSIGLQSASDEILKKIGRIHSVEQFITAVKKIQSYGIKNISGDLILGLPNQDETDIKRAVKIFTDLGLTHASVYALSVEEGTPLYAQGYAPDDDFQADLYDYAVNLLAQNGFKRYEVSNFARDNKISNHNYKYWVGADYYGFGVSAHSLIKGKRYENAETLEKYLANPLEKKVINLTVDDIKEEKIMLSLRTTKGLSLAEYEEKFGNLIAQKEREILKMKANGLIEIEDGFLRVTDKGFYLLNTIITELI